MITRRDSRDSSCLREIDALLLFRDGVTGMSGHSRPYSTYFHAFSYLSLSSLFLSFSSLHLVSLQKRYKLLFIKNTFGLIYDTVPLLLLQRKEGKESLVSLSQGISIHVSFSSNRKVWRPEWKTRGETSWKDPWLDRIFVAGILFFLPIRESTVKVSRNDIIAWRFLSVPTKTA